MFADEPRLDPETIVDPWRYIVLAARRMYLSHENLASDSMAT